MDGKNRRGGWCRAGSVCQCREGDGAVSGVGKRLEMSNGGGGRCVGVIWGCGLDSIARWCRVGLGCLGICTMGVGMIGR